MDLSTLSNVTLFALAAGGFFVVAILMILMISRDTIASTTKPSIWRRLFTGESLSESGLRYRIIAFIALMFTFMNIVGTVVIYLASQAKA